MATIITKNSTGSGVTPSSLQQGELAINVVDGRLFYGSGSGNIVKEFTGGGIAGGTLNYIPLWTSPTTQGTSSIYQNGNFLAIHYSGSPEDPLNPELLYVHGAGINTYNLISVHGDLNNYTQINIKNYNSGSAASSDVVVTADNGTESVGFIDMGINSSGYTNTGFVGEANDAYVYSTGENLLIGNATPGKQVVIFNGGTDAAGNAKMFIHDTNVGVIGINTDTIGDINNPAALRIVPPNTNTYNLIEAESNVNLYSQFKLTNLNSGVSASSDIVAQNDISTETSYYIDMGINSSGHMVDPSYTVGGPNDTYLLSTGRNHYIGSSTTGSITIFTGNNFDGETHAKLILKPNNQHQMSGSLSVSGSITASLLGTASYATQALSASWAPTIPTFPYTGSARITGSLNVIGNTTISGSLLVSRSINTSNRTLITSTNTDAIDWQNGYLFYNGSSVASIAWTSGISNDIAANPSINWYSRYLQDSVGTSSIDWGNRILRDTTNTYASLDWSNSNYVNSELYVSSIKLTTVQENFSATSDNYGGDIIEGDMDVTSNVWDLMYLGTDGVWHSVDQTTDSSTKKLGICLTDPTKGAGNILLRGHIVVNDIDSGIGPYLPAANYGLPIYIKTGGVGVMSMSVPTSGYVRILGHPYYNNTSTTSQWTIDFNPDNSWTKI